MAKQQILNMKEEKPSIANQVSENSTLRWIVNNAVNIILGILVLFSILFLFYRLSSNRQIRAENEYFTAEKDFAAFTGQGEAAEALTRQDALNQLDNIMKRYPELHAKYDGLIAQELLFQEQTAEALPYANRSLQRISKNDTPNYQEFAEITLLIAQGDYPSALAKSRELNQELGKDEIQFTPIFAYNLIRLAILENQQGNQEKELQAWEGLDQALYSAEALLVPDRRELRTQFESIFSHGSISLKNYIDHRIKILKTVQSH